MFLQAAAVEKGGVLGIFGVGVGLVEAAPLAAKIFLGDLGVFAGIGLLPGVLVTGAVGGRLDGEELLVRAAIDVFALGILTAQPILF